MEFSRMSLFVMVSVPCFSLEYLRNPFTDRISKVMMNTQIAVFMVCNNLKDNETNAKFLKKKKEYKYISRFRVTKTR